MGGWTVMAGEFPPSPRHPYPELRAEFEPHGWSFFQTTTVGGEPVVHAVFCATLPPACARRHGFTEHLWGRWSGFRSRVADQVTRFERHITVCGACARAHERAVRHAKAMFR